MKNQVTQSLVDSESEREVLDQEIDSLTNNRKGTQEMAAITVAEFIKDLPETTVVGSKKKKWGVYFFNSDQDGPKFLRGYGSTGAQDILPETCEVAHIPGLKVLKEVVKKPLEGFVVFAGGKPAAIALTESDAGSEADKLGVECEIFPFSGTYEVEVNG